MFDVRGNQGLRTSSGERSELFQRGWTLQELLAPRYVSLYDQDWTLLGTKESLGGTISYITNIDEAILRGESFTSRSIAQRMSWAAGRKTSRIEDRAYSLLGLFGVYMPTLYGEGGNAFLRLQQEIIRQSDDHSIFAWPIQTNYQPGLLASNPDAFSGCEHIISMSSRRGRSPYSMTNRGLAIKLMAVPSSVDTYLVRLDCADERVVVADDEPSQPRLGMFLRRLQEDDQYARVMQDGRTFARARTSLWEERSSRKVVHLEFFVKQHYTGFDDDKKDRINGFRIVTRDVLTQTTSGKNLFNFGGPCSFDVETGIMTAKPGVCGTTGWLDLHKQNRVLQSIKLGFDVQFNPVCFLTTSDEAGTQLPERDPFDHGAWNEAQGTSVMTVSAQTGLCALRGDRLDPLYANVFELGTVRIVRGAWYEKLVWEVYLEDLKSTLVGNIKGRFKRSGGFREWPDKLVSSLQ